MSHKAASHQRERPKAKNPEQPSLSQQDRQANSHPPAYENRDNIPTHNLPEKLAEVTRHDTDVRNVPDISPNTYKNIKKPHLTIAHLVRAAAFQQRIKLGKVTTPALTS